MARVLYFDCFSGAAGDMLLGALLDAGLPLDALRAALGSLGVEHELRVSRVVRAGLSATHVDVAPTAASGDRDAAARPHEDASTPVAARQAHAHPHDHAPEQSHSPAHASSHGHTHDGNRTHGHDHGAHGHHSLDEIAHHISHSALSAAGKARAIALFRRLGEVEAAIHGVPIDRIHLHEVGAVDSIIDVVGVVFAMEWFGIDDIVASPLNVGSGTIEIAHGTFPVPAPATATLLAGVPVYSRGPALELVTPTGALLVSAYARAFGPMPAMIIERVGYGAGTRDVPGMPNVLRVLVGERTARAAAVATAPETVLEIRCEIDDMNPQLFGPAMDRLFEAGALDVFLTPIVMKKERPGTLVTVLATDATREPILDVLFRETTTIGVRMQAVAREPLERTFVEVATPGGPIRVKVASRRGAIVNASPEFDDCVRVARATGRPLKDVQADAIAAWRARPSS